MTGRGAALLAVLAGLAGPAFADCTDGAAPKVKWHRCLQDDRAMTGVDLSEATLREAYANMLGEDAPPGGPASNLRRVRSARARGALVMGWVPWSRT